MTCFNSISHRMEQLRWNVPFTINPPDHPDGRICGITRCNPSLYRENTLEKIGFLLQKPFYALITLDCIRIARGFRCRHIVLIIVAIVPGILAGIGFVITKAGQCLNSKHALRVEAYNKLQEIYRIYRQGFDVFRNVDDVFLDNEYDDFANDKSLGRFNALKAAGIEGMNAGLAHVSAVTGVAFDLIPTNPTSPEQQLYLRLQTLYGQYNALAERIRA